VILVIVAIFGANAALNGVGVVIKQYIEWFLRLRFVVSRSPCIDRGASDE
jgi:hypothetical protein